MNILITLCARGGSKGIPGKNIRIINGLPLIAYSIIVAKKFSLKYKATIVLSTDSKEIKNIASVYDIYTDYIRPDFLASDTAGKVDTISDVLNFYTAKHNTEYDLVLDLDITSPLRTFEDLENGMRIILENPNCLSLFSVNKASRNPYFNMVEQKENGYYNVVKKLQSDFYSRQTAPQVYDINASFYFYKSSFFKLGNRSAITEKSLIYEMPHICFDLDEIEDFEYMEYLLESKKWIF